MNLLTQLPMVLVAGFFVNAKQAVYDSGSELGFSILILLSLIFILIDEPRPFSLDSFLHDS